MAISFHPLAGLFPLLDGEEFARLVEDIHENGLREPILIYYDEILDGRNRYRACLEAGVEPKFEIYAGEDPLGLVISLNLHRRHLSESQRAMVAARISTMRQGERTDLEPSANLRKVSQADAAQLLGVSERSVTSAAKVEAHGVPGLKESVSAGGVKVSTAAELATLTAE